MPYRGRPSAGCQTCRKRKIKPGYRDLTDLLFHDESAKVAKKLENEYNKRQKSDAPSSAGRETPDHQVTRKPSQSIVVPRVVGASPCLSAFSFAYELEDLALGFFANTYITIEADKRWTVEDGNGCLLSSVQALGAAGVLRKGHASSGMKAAHDLYLKAINLTNEALRSPSLVKRNSTLQAIIVLGIFESVAGISRSLASWRAHTQGAAALLQLRGKQQFSTQTGCRLYLQACTNLSIACINQRLPIPQDIWEMEVEVEKHSPNPENGAVFRWHKAHLRLAQLHSRLLPGNTLRSRSDGRSVIDDALALSLELDTILESLPHEWRPVKIYGRGPTVFSNWYYVFREFLIATVWTGICSGKLLLIDIVQNTLADCLNHPGFALTAHERPVVDRLVCSQRELQLNILATVPQHLGFPDDSAESRAGQLLAQAGATAVPWRKDKLWRNFQGQIQIPFPHARKLSPDLPFVRLSGGYVVQWSLYAAGAADERNGAIRLWTIGVLRKLGQHMGVVQACVLAEILEQANARQQEQTNLLTFLAAGRSDFIRDYEASASATASGENW